MTPAPPTTPWRSGARKKPWHTPASDEVTTGLALAARGGDPDKTDHFVRALHHDVRRYVAHLSADPQAADDLTQDVFVRAPTALPRFEGRSSARTWLLSIARRTVVDDLRRTAARPRLSDRYDWQTAAEQSQPTGVPGFEEGSRWRSCSRCSLPTGARRSSSPSSSAWGTRRRPRRSGAPSAPSAPGWPVRGRPDGPAHRDRPGSRAPGCRRSGPHAREETRTDGDTGLTAER